MARVRYDMPTPEALPDPAGTLREDLARPDVRELIKPGERIAIGVGSRGINRLDELVKTLLGSFGRWGRSRSWCPPWAATVGPPLEEQAEVLEHLGVTEERVGAPVLSDMTTEEIGRLEERYTGADRPSGAAGGWHRVRRQDQAAHRVPRDVRKRSCQDAGHRAGQAGGAALTHARGFGEMGRMVPAMAEVVLRRAPIRFAVAVLENAHDRIFALRVVPADRMMAEEPAMLERARDAMPRIPFEQLDVLVIDEIGKNISGDGADPNVTGRYPTEHASGGPAVTRQVLLDLTTASHGNANGAGTADFITLRLARKFDLAGTYPNALTSTVPGPVKIPMILPSDRLAIAASILTCNAVGRPVRIMRIANTLDLAGYQVSPALLDEVRADPTQSYWASRLRCRSIQTVICKSALDPRSSWPHHRLRTSIRRVVVDRVRRSSAACCMRAGADLRVPPWIDRSCPHVSSPRIRRAGPRTNLAASVLTDLFVRGTIHEYVCPGCSTDRASRTSSLPPARGAWLIL